MKINDCLRRIKKYYNLRQQINLFVRYYGSDPELGGTIRKTEVDVLQKLTQKANEIDGPIIEIGTLFGFSTHYMAINKSTDKQLITVDNYRWNPMGISPDAHRFLTKTSLCYLTNKCNVTIVDKDSQEFYTTYDGPKPSMVFIDACHRYEEVVIDVDWAVSKKAPIICGHDYDFPGVNRAVTEYFGKTVNVVDSLWAVELT